MRKNAGPDWPEVREAAMNILQQEAKLQEVVRLVGIESLSQKEQLVLDTAKAIREDFLQQNAFDAVDTYTSVKKTYLMLKAIMTLHESALAALDSGKTVKDLAGLPQKEKIARAKLVPESKLSELEELIEEISTSCLEKLGHGY